MSYPRVSSDDFIDNLLTRKEFYSLKIDPERNFRDPGEDTDETVAKHLKISSYQLFVGNFVNPNTPYKRLHLKFMTGGGKTLGALYAAHKFIATYRKLYAVASSKVQNNRKNLQELDHDLPTVFVLGFEGTKSAFLRDLMKYPDFGFITLSEKEELVKRQNLAASGMVDDVRYYREYYAIIKKRITNKARGGFFKFFGYDKFVNRLFYSEKVSLTDLENIVSGEIKAGRDTTLEDVIRDHISRGVIQVNTQMMEMFKNSLLICDEIHNTYNMNMKNNRGVAIQYILDSEPSVRFLSLSATPINNSPTEVVDWANYLVPADKKITKKEMFSGRNLLPGKLEEIGNMLIGRVSFLQDVNIKYFPKSEFVGAEITIPHDIGDMAAAGSVIPYLKFVECPMSKFHQDTLSEYQKNPMSASEETSAITADLPTPSDATSAPNTHTPNTHTPNTHTPNTHTPNALTPISEALIAEDIGTIDEALTDTATADDDLLEPVGDHSYPAIPTDGYSIYDIAFPDPTSTHGMFRSSEVRGKLLGASSAWRDKIGITIKKYSAINYSIGGDFLRADNIGKYSTKYHRILTTLSEIFRADNNDPKKCQKVMIYHDRVKMSGVLLIQELLRANGFIDEFMSPVDTTICCICGRTMSQHVQSQQPPTTQSQQPPTTHQFRPARFVIAHSDIEHTVMNQSLVKFNAQDNAHGTNYMILIGSKIIKESYDFKDIQHLILTSLPVNIPTFLQVIGRCIRKSSHINLPPEQRRVRIYILVSTINRAHEYTDEISPEIYRYVDKLTDYIIIQNIEREIIRKAIDADLNRDIIMPPDLYATYFPATGGPVDRLGNLYFEPAHTINVRPEEVKTSTFISGRYFEEEIRTICFIIKRLFMKQTVWTYEQLWEQVQKPPMGIEVNPRLFSEDNFIIALENLVKKTTGIITSKTSTTQTLLLERLFDYSDSYVYISGQKMQVDKIGKYYIAFPVATAESDPLNAVIEAKEIVRDRERALIKSAPKLREHPIIDVEMYVRANVPSTGVVVSVDGFIADNRSNATYLSRREEFLKTELTGEELMIYFLSHFTDRFQIGFIEEAIIASMSGGKAGGGSLSERSELSVGELGAVNSEVVGAASGDDNTKSTASSEVILDITGALDAVPLHSEVLDIMNQFRVLITAAEVRKYRDTAKQYKNGVPDLDGPIGYMTARVVRLYDPDDARWIEVSKIALNRQIRYKENEVVIGYFETVEDSMKFKLRSPIQLIDTKKASKGKVAVSDTRLIERGIVCGTKNKHELLTIISKLGISASKLERQELRIKRLCGIVMRHLITRELRERSKDTRYKFLYSWWDEMPDLTKIE